MKRALFSAAAAALTFVAISNFAVAATQPAVVDQEATQALASKISAAIKALGDAPSEKQVLDAIAAATNGADVATIGAALKVLSSDTSLPTTAQAGIKSAAEAAQLALNQNGGATGGVGGTNQGAGGNYINSIISTSPGSGGGGYLPQ